MTGDPHRLAPLDLHAYVDGRLDADRARVIEAAVAAAGGAEFERLQAWTRGRDALREAYDPIALEAPPTFLSVAARVASHAPQPALATPGPRVEQRGRFPAFIVAISFLAGATTTVLGAAAFAVLADPATPSIAAAIHRALELIARGVGFSAF